MNFKKLLSKFFNIILFILTLTVFEQCNVYSFTGTSIPKDAKTICVYYIENTASLIQPNLSNALTEALKTKCLNETQLTWKEENADISFSGKILDYKVEPIAIQNNETAAQNRLTITLEIIFINIIDESQNFKTTFSSYEDFDSDKNLYEEEESLNNIIVTNLVTDIFNAGLVNW
ncbi:MAG: hypothetical protein CMP49_02440 [Flavobacteriales bacterium]|nr:hypothetical protein [Flavobacteriales bacterium]|tara:strand:- start:5265 stop:5789 length:525 start_codon:yes stop_codon:yes gene_type:complete